MKKLLMVLLLLPLMAAAETWYDPSTGRAWLYSEELGDTPGRWGGVVCELNSGEINASGYAWFDRSNGHGDGVGGAELVD